MGARATEDHLSSAVLNGELSQLVPDLLWCWLCGQLAEGCQPPLDVQTPAQRGQQARGVVMIRQSRGH